MASFNISPQSPVPDGAVPQFLVGVDGGGTGTRARIQNVVGHTVGFGLAGPSALAQGVEQAWQHVEQAIAAAFASGGLAVAPRASCALGLGLAGVVRGDLRAEFLAANPGYGHCVLDTDVRTTLIGAHRGQPGIVVAAGTGSVAAAMDEAGVLRVAGGWGFPVGDEGSGAWLGLHAVQLAMAALDGRDQAGPLERAVFAVTGDAVPELLAWCATAGQNTYARLAPLVFDAARQGDARAQRLLQAAADELARLARALQHRGRPLPICLTGSIGERLAAWWPADLRAQCIAAAGDSADGALQMLRAELGMPTHAAKVQTSGRHE